MQRRILFSAAGLVVGLASSALFEAAFHFETRFALIVGGTAGLLIGFFVAILVDAFTASEQRPFGPSDY